MTESARDVCALGLRLQSVLEELDNMPQSGPVEKADEMRSGGVSVGRNPARRGTKSFQ